MAELPERGDADGAECDEKPAAATQPKSAALAWEPDPALLAQLVGLGISVVAARKGLFYTGNTSADAAASWVFENADNVDVDLDTPLEVEASRESMSDLALERCRHTRDIFKMVFVVNASLTMGVGKIAAQVAHAALGLHQILLQLESKYGDWLIKWQEYGETKIVLRGETTSHLIELEKRAMDCDLPCYLVSLRSLLSATLTHLFAAPQVQDAGKTQIAAGSTTVLAIFGHVDTVDTVTGTLRLL